MTLGVASEMIAAQTAVSRAVAEAMATGALERCPANIAIAITGVAGPEPDEDGNPVGLMHVAVGVRGGSVHHRAHRFQDSLAWFDSLDAVVLQHCSPVSPAIADCSQAVATL